DATGSPVALQYDSGTGADLAARYRPADDAAGGWRLGGGKWRTGVFLMRDAQFAHRQNLGADFRLQGSGLSVRSVALSRSRPANWEEVDRMQPTDVKPLVKIGPGGQLIVGGFDPARATDATPTAHQLE